MNHVYPPLSQPSRITTADAARQETRVLDCRSAVGLILTGITRQQRFGGAKLLTVWGEIKGPMAEYAATTFTTQESLDILAFLLQKNGLPAGKQPLTDTPASSRIHFPKNDT